MKKTQLTQEEEAAFRAQLKECLHVAKALVRLQKEAAAIVPPEIFAKAHSVYSNVVPETLKSLWPIAQFASDAVEGRVKPGAYSISVKIYSPSLEQFGREIANADEVLTLLKKSKKREAVAVYRQSTHADQREAERAIESLVAANKLKPRTGCSVLIVVGLVTSIAVTMLLT